MYGALQNLQIYKSAKAGQSAKRGNDRHLEMKVHVQNVVRAANFELRRIGSIRRFLSAKAAATLVSAFVLSRVDYCNSLLYGCHGYLLDRLQRVQNNAARMVLRIPR